MSQPDVSAVTLYPWQEQIVEQCRNLSGDSAKVQWIVDKRGNTGKSYLVQFLQQQNPHVVRVSCDALNMKVLLDKIGNISQPIIIFDGSCDDILRLTRSVKQVHNSLVLEGKNPYIIVFENDFPCPPDPYLFQVALLHNTQDPLEYYKYNVLEYV